MTPKTGPTNPHDGRRQDGGPYSEGRSDHGLIHFEQTIDINRRAEDVFAYLADFTNIPRWNYYVNQVSQLTPGPVAVGTVYDQTRRTDRQRFEVTVYQAPTLLAASTLRGERPAFHRHFELETIGERTRLHDRWDLDLGHLSTLQRLAAPWVRSAVGENLAVLKRLLEQGGD
jgi:hypothetical protein